MICTVNSLHCVKNAEMGVVVDCGGSAVVIVVVVVVGVLIVFLFGVAVGIGVML